MTEAEAIALAMKRERHKSKYMTHKRWAAVHNSVRGWHVALVDVPKPAPEPNPMLAGGGVSLGDIVAMALVIHAIRSREGK